MDLQMMVSYVPQVAIRIDELPLMSSEIPIASALIYAAGVPTLKFLLKNAPKRPGWLTPLAKVHNLILCLWSLLMLLGTIVEVIRSNGSLQQNFCCAEGESLSDALRFWYWVYYISKYYELLDTVILILKGRDTSFLHVYHHSFVIVNSWLWVRGEIPYAAFGIAFNTFVHVLMYWYFFQAARGIHPWWKKYLTQLQIFQFVTALVTAVLYCYYHFTVACKSFETFLISTGFNATLLFLFIDFFRASYKQKRT